jgi:hypothetical protein
LKRSRIRNCDREERGLGGSGVSGVSSGCHGSSDGGAVAQEVSKGGSGSSVSSGATGYQLC